MYGEKKYNCLQKGLKWNQSGKDCNQSVSEGQRSGVLLDRSFSIAHFSCFKVMPHNTSSRSIKHYHSLFLLYVWRSGRPDPNENPTPWPSYQWVLALFTGVWLGLSPLCLLRAQDAAGRSTSYWIQELSRQNDSSRKAEILLFIAKDLETTAPQRALSYAQQALALGQNLKAPKVQGMALLQLSRIEDILGNRGKSRRYRRQAEAQLRSVDLMAELKRLETQKAKAEDMAESRAAEVASTQEEVNQLSLESRQKQDRLARQGLLIERKNSLLGQKDELLVQKDSILTQHELALRFQQDQIKILEQEKALQAAEVEYERTVRNALLAGAGLLLLLAGLLWRLIANKQRANRELARKNAQLDAARKRSDELLLNILPSELVDELKIQGITRTRHHEDVTIMFTDFRDFTKISEKLSPTDLVQEIDYCFRHFDHIIGKYPSIEKIKTIGDAYLCAGGLPEAHPHHAREVVAAALEIRDFIQELEQQRRREGKLWFQIRIGVHTGPVVAGVVGATKFAYDIWGDTVNTAARLESASEPGQVNISDATYQRVKDFFQCQHRGEISTKNKADMNMYFVESAITTGTLYTI
jgi:adenylate cyclase